MKGYIKDVLDLFRSGGSTLEIPVYQRNYDWGHAQCERLFDDLEDLALTDPKDRPKHFFGVVVGKSDGRWRWIVIDGQQRLTTVSILMLALVHAIKGGELTTENQSLGDDIIDDYLKAGKRHGDTKFKLKPVKNDAAAYEALFGPKEDFLEDSNVTANYRHLRDRLQSSALSADQLWDALSRLEVMSLDVEPHDDPQVIFESLNSTGLRLSEADKIRNLVLMNQDFEQQTWLYESRWNPTEANVDGKMSWFIRWYLVARTGKTPKESDVFEAFKTYLSRTDHSVAEVLDDMFAFSKYSRAIMHASTGIPTVDRQLQRSRMILGDVVHPFLMPVLGDLFAGVIEEDDFIGVLRTLESYIFRRVICSVASNALNKIMASAYGELRKLRTGNQRYTDLLIWILRRRDGASGRFPDNAEFVEAFRTRDFYRISRSEYRQYLFDVLENQNSRDQRDIAAGIKSGDLTIEHIMPQTLTTAWEVELGPQYEKVHSTWVNRIANLTVTGYNSAYSNSSFAAKKSMTGGFDSSPYRLNAELKEADHWDEEQLKRRGDRLLQEALEYWPLMETDFRPPEVVLPTEPMGRETNFRGRKVTAYELGDVKETVKGWAELFPKVITVLLQDYRTAVIEFAEGEAQLTTDTQQLAYPAARLQRIDPVLGVWTSKGTEAKIAALRRLFDHLELDPEELVFTLSNNVHSSHDAEDEESKPKRYDALTKFLDQADELAEMSTTPEDSQMMRTEFAREFTEFKPDNPIAGLGGKPVEAFLAETSIDQASESECLALLAFPALMGPSAEHEAITSGRFSALLRRLDDLG